MKTITEPARKLQIFGDYDVVVVGGGIAGIAAAVAASRNGARTLLMEKEYALGGLATLGNVIMYLPLCDGKGNQVIGGIGEELLKLSVADVSRKNSDLRLNPIPSCWQEGTDLAARCEKRYRADFNAGSLILAAESWVKDAGVDLLYDARFADTVVEDGMIQAVVFESKSGRQAVTCRSVVDCTGDADVCAASGEATESLDSNVAAGWFYLYRNGSLKLQTISRKYSTTASKEDAVGPFYRGDDVRGVTNQILDSRQMARERLQKARQESPADEIYPFQLATFPGFRMTRRLKGKLDIRQQDDHRWFDDCIGMTGDWRKRGPIYFLPFRSLVGSRVGNLLAAGRCFSTHADIWDAMRVIPTCAVTGEAAGTAAALASQTTSSCLPDLNIAQLQDVLKANQVIMDRAMATTDL